MTKQLRVSPDLALPEDAVTSTLIVFGGKGMGKTNFGAVLVEEMSAMRLHWVVLDGLGVWWGLRHSSDGEGRGIECLILGGVNGDLPIEPTGGEIVADLVVDEDVDVIVDFSRRPDGRLWSKGEKVRFVTDFARRIFMRQGEIVDGRMRPPLHVLLDEAARYIPQIVRAGDKEAAFSVSAWEDLVEEGRNVGIGVTLLTQRSARINKSVSELADALLAFRTVGPLSVGAITDWLGEHVPKERIRELVERIRSLPVGTALVVSPGWLQFEDVVGVRARKTFDSSATPKAGETRRVTGQAAKPDLAKYQQRMADTIERAKADDPKELRRRIRALEQEITKRPTETKVETVEKIVEVPVLGNGQVDELAGAVAQMWRLREEFQGVESRLYGAHGEVLHAVRQLGVDIDKYGTVSEREQHGRSMRGPSRTETEVRPLPPAPAPEVDGKVRLGQAERTFLAALAQHPTGLSRTRLSLITGYSSKSGHFANVLGRLRGFGFVARGEPIRITDEGVAQLDDVRPLPAPGPELVEYWRGRLGRAERAFLDAFVAVWPDALSREELAERTGYSSASGHFANVLGRIRGLGLIEGWRASDELMGQP